ncbi:hypothetical protein JTB14_009021 [Gonioctena quinquepunctata]|nr:hypothetical protein JTB14_009021 [Gonioctena quinquepunctata]
MNGTTTASLTLEGAVDSDGTCEGSKYHENGQVWKDVVIIATIGIQNKPILANWTNYIPIRFIDDVLYRDILRTRLLMTPLVPSTLSQLVKEDGGYVGIIQTHAEEVDSDGLMPPLYLIDDQWMGLSPYHTMKKAPEGHRNPI